MHRSAPLGFLLLALAVGPLQAGDPVPDIDVTIEQVPGNEAYFDVSTGGAFNEVRLTVPKRIAKSFSPGKLPPGWSLTQDGKALVVKGPEVEPPVRLRLVLSGDERPREMSYEVRRGGTSLLRRENVVPRTIPRRQVRNSLEGIVVLPSQVSPGEPMAFRTIDAAEVPPGGRFTLSGVVAEPFTEEEWNEIPQAIVNTTRSHLKTLAAQMPSGGIEVEGPAGACSDLAPLATVAAMAMASNPKGKEPQKEAKWAVADLSGSAKARHEPAMGAIRNIKFFYAAAPAGGENNGISIQEEGVEISIKEQGIKFWRVTAAGSTVGASRKVGWGVAQGELPLADPATQAVALRGEPTATGCRFHSREPGWSEVARTIVNTSRSNIKSGLAPPPEQTANAQGALSGTVYVADLPETQTPGSLLSLQYLDRFGDLWLDVPAVSDVNVTPPREGTSAETPCIRAATRHALLGDLVCVCGTFPTPSAWSGLLVGDRPAGTPASASSRAVWIVLPEGTPLGKNTIAGRRDLGFAPDCQATTDAVMIRGEIDSERILRGETTPMRLQVVGTTDPVPVRIRNLTPSIIQIEGGLDQRTESSGGQENLITARCAACRGEPSTSIGLWYRRNVPAGIEPDGSEVGGPRENPRPGYTPRPVRPFEGGKGP